MAIVILSPRKLAQKIVCELSRGTPSYIVGTALCTLIMLLVTVHQVCSLKCLLSNHLPEMSEELDDLILILLFLFFIFLNVIVAKGLMNCGFATLKRLHKTRPGSLLQYDIHNTPLIQISSQGRKRTQSYNPSRKRTQSYNPSRKRTPSPHQKVTRSRKGYDSRTESKC